MPQVSKKIFKKIQILFFNFKKIFRVLNNHPDVFTKEKRPIVEFAVENAKAIKLLAGRRENIQKKKKLQEQMGSGTGGIYWSYKGFI